MDPRASKNIKHNKHCQKLQVHHKMLKSSKKQKTLKRGKKDIIYKGIKIRKIHIFSLEQDDEKLLSVSIAFLILELFQPQCFKTWKDLFHLPEQKEDI